MSGEQPNPVERHEYDNVRELETEHARYLIVYNNHGYELPPELLDGKDALFLELVYPRDQKTLSQKLSERVDPQAENQDPDGYVRDQLLLRAAREQVPVYLVDTTEQIYTEFKMENEMENQGKLQVLEAGAGVALLVSASKDLGQQDKTPITRRDFLRRLRGLAKAIGGAYLVSPAVENSVFGHLAGLLGHPSEKDLARQSHRAIAGINQVLHPEMKSGVLHYRNTVMAEKAEAAAQRLGATLGRKPEVVLPVGAEHFGIEEELRRNSAQRVSDIEARLGESAVRENVVVRVDFAQSQEDPTAVHVGLSQFRAW